MFLFVFVGSFLFRFDARTLGPGLLKEPPRTTRPPDEQPWTYREDDTCVRRVRLEGCLILRNHPPSCCPI